MNFKLVKPNVILFLNRFQLLLLILGLSLILSACDCGGYFANVRVWIDENENGKWDTGEEPFPNVMIFLDDIQTARKNVGGSPTLTDLNGEARPSTGMYSCGRVSFEVYPEIPAGYKLTTAERQQTNGRQENKIFEFGFAPIAGALPNPQPALPISCVIHTIEMDGSVDPQISDIEFGQDDTLWLIANDLLKCGFVHVSLGNMPEPIQVENIQDLHNSEITGIAITPDDKIWFSTGMGVRYWDGMSWTIYGAEDGLASDYVHDVAVSADRSIWFATRKGLSIFIPEMNNWVTYFPTGGLSVPSDLIWEIIFSPDNTAWLIKYESITLVRLTGEFAEQPDILIVQSPIKIYSSAIGVDGSLWVAGVYQEDKTPSTTVPAVAHYNPVTQAWNIYTHKSTNGDMVGDTLTSIAVAADGSVWIGTGRLYGTKGSGVMHFIPDIHDPNDGTWTLYTTRDGLPGNNIGYIAAESDSIIWIASGNKFARCQIIK